MNTAYLISVEKAFGVKLRYHDTGFQCVTSQHLQGRHLDAIRHVIKTSCITEFHCHVYLGSKNPHLLEEVN